MTTFDKQKLTCVICGKESEHYLLASTNAFGSPDLDLRPPEMRRSTMPFWVQECPYCGYVSEDLERCSYIDSGATTLYHMHSFVGYPEYASCAQEAGIDEELAARFFKRSFIAQQFHDHLVAMRYLLRAAWVYDDLGDTQKATKLRKMAAEQSDLVEGAADREEAAELLLVREDLLRRSGQFDRLIEEYSGLVFDDQTHRDISAFQIKKAKEHDTGCYTVADAVSGDDGDDEIDRVNQPLEDDEDLPVWLLEWMDSPEPVTGPFDREYLHHVGIAFADGETAERFLRCINEDLETRIGERISEGLSEEMLREYDEAEDLDEAAAFLRKNRPDYADIVEQVIREVDSEIRYYRRRIPQTVNYEPSPHDDPDMSGSDHEE